jgi:hypothetical protein
MTFVQLTLPTYGYVFTYFYSSPDWGGFTSLFGNGEGY